MLVYADPLHRSWGAPDYAKVLGYSAEPDGTLHPFFDTVLLIPLYAPSSRGYTPGVRRPPSLSDDWDAEIERLFAPERGDLAELDSAAAAVSIRLGDPSYRARVIVSIPFPDPRVGSFGIVPECSPGPLDFRRGADRSCAVRRYVEEVFRRWSSAPPGHLVLAGFYWLGERVDGDDGVVIRSAARAVHDHGLLTYWIPYFGARGAGDWKKLGIDRAVYQPNYFFRDVPAERISVAWTFARDHGLGLEIEFDGRAIAEERFRRKLFDYLDAGRRLGFIDAPTVAVYQGDGALLDAAGSQDPAARAVYDAVYRFVRGEPASAP